jgi:hypothetical protein
MSLEPGLVELIVGDVAREPGSLPLLWHTLLETWRHRGGPVMTVAGYEEAGGVREAIARTAEQVYTGFSTEQQAIARSIFLRLTELGDGTEETRRRTQLDELAPRDGAGPLAMRRCREG